MSVLKVKTGENQWVSIPTGGVGVPSGGTQGQVLTKTSATDYATQWADPTGSGSGAYIGPNPPADSDIDLWVDTDDSATGGGVPPGGTTGQVLTKTGAADYAAGWASLKPMILDLAHPVGCYYWSSDSTDPGILFGGTWTQVKDRFILAAGDAYTAGDTGGEAEHTLAQAELPNVTLGINYGSFQLRNTPAFAGGSTSQAGYGTTGGEYRTDPLGSGQAHNNMPPYEAAYCWKRTA